MEGGELTKIVKMAKYVNMTLSEEFCRYTLFCVASGLRDLHEKNVLHRDIKSDNILFKADGTIKIADLGFSVLLTKETERRMTSLGTLSWMSPEIAQGCPYAKEVDVWSFGCFAFELTKGSPPYNEHVADAGTFLEKLRSQDEIERLPAQYSDQFADFVR